MMNNSYATSYQNHAGYGMNQLNPSVNNYSSGSSSWPSTTSSQLNQWNGDRAGSMDYNQMSISQTGSDLFGKTPGSGQSWVQGDGNQQARAAHGNNNGSGMMTGQSNNPMQGSSFNSFTAQPSQTQANPSSYSSSQQHQQQSTNQFGGYQSQPPLGQASYNQQNNSYSSQSNPEGQVKNYENILQQQSQVQRQGNTQQQSSYGSQNQANPYSYWSASPFQNQGQGQSQQQAYQGQQGALASQQQPDFTNQAQSGFITPQIQQTNNYGNQTQTQTQNPLGVQGSSSQTPQNQQQQYGQASNSAMMGQQFGMQQQSSGGAGGMAQFGNALSAGNTSSMQPGAMAANGQFGGGYLNGGFQQQPGMVMAMNMMGMGLQLGMPETPKPEPEPPKPKVLEAKEVFLKPGRESRPDRICVILRGLPGSGKTYVARKLRDIEKAAPDGLQPRILSLDDYFLTETTEMRTDANGVRRKEKVMKYEFDPEMETVYIAAFLKSFKKTIDDGHFRFIIVEGINCMVCHFEEFWKAAKSKGFEVYIVDLPLDAELCASRNKYTWNASELQEVADRWEETPAHMLVMDTKSLFEELEKSAKEEQESQRENESSEPKRKRRGFKEADFSSVSNDVESKSEQTKRKRRSFQEAEFSELAAEFSIDTRTSAKPVVSSKKVSPPAKQKSRWANDSDSENDSDDGEENALSSLLGEYSSTKKKKKMKRRVTWADPVDDWGDRSKRYLFEEADTKTPHSGGFMLGAVKDAKKMKEHQERQNRLKSVRGIVKQTLSDDRSILDKALEEHHIKNKKQNILTALHQLIEEEEDEDA